jgi:hypothetical protein
LELLTPPHRTESGRPGEDDPRGAAVAPTEVKMLTTLSILSRDQGPKWREPAPRPEPEAQTARLPAGWPARVLRLLFAGRRTA